MGVCENKCCSQRGKEEGRLVHITQSSPWVFTVSLTCWYACPPSQSTPRLVLKDFLVFTACVAADSQSLSRQPMVPPTSPHSPVLMAVCMCQWATPLALEPRFDSCDFHESYWKVAPLVEHLCHSHTWAFYCTVYPCNPMGISSSVFTLAEKVGLGGYKVVCHEGVSGWLLRVLAHHCQSQSDQVCLWNVLVSVLAVLRCMTNFCCCSYKRMFCFLQGIIAIN